jgi:hypothetical protein
MRNDHGFRFSVFGFQELSVFSASCFQLSAFDPFAISNLKSQLRAAAGGRL